MLSEMSAKEISVSILYDEVVTNSPVYKAVKADVGVKAAHPDLGYGPTSMGVQLDDVDANIYLPIQAFEDKGIPFDNDELDRSAPMQETMLLLAKLADGATAHNMLCGYMHDCDLPQCQLHIAENHQAFYKGVTDKSLILGIVQTYLQMVA